MRIRRPYPRHPYPHLLSPTPRADSSPEQPLPRKARQILASIKKGARILFDMKRGRALLYRIRHGFEEMGELTVHMLALLVKRGYLAPAGQEGRLVHYALATEAPN